MLKSFKIETIMTMDDDDNEQFKLYCTNWIKFIVDD